MPEVRTLPQAGEFETLHFARQWFDTPIAGVGITADTEGTHGANTRRFSIQVKDRLRKDWAGRWVVLVWVSETDGGDPSATGNTVAVVAGTYTVQTVTANAVYVLLTDANGSAAFDLTIAGTASRYVNGIVIGKAESKPFIWA